MDISLPNPKTQKLLKESEVRENEDRISKLPDSVLSHILSFLTTKNVVGTSILATRWKNLWASIPDLDFDHKEFSDYHFLVNFVENVLLSEISYVRKFRFKCWGLCDTYRVTTWIRAAVKYKVEYLDIDITTSSVKIRGTYQKQFVELPGSLFRCKTLVVLKLSCVVVNVQQLVCLPNVKILHLREVKSVGDEAVKVLISCCPVLEDLSITKCDGDNLKVLCVCSHALKNLRIKFSGNIGVTESKVVIDAPNLEGLYLEDLVSESIIINNSNSLFKAYINVSLTFDTWTNDFLSRLLKLLNAISNVRYLSLGQSTFVALECNFCYRETLPMFCNLTHLEVEFCDSSWRLLPTLLKNSPKLKAVVINKESGPVPNDYWIWLRAVPQCLLSCLESVEIQIRLSGEEGEMNLLRYFLENSKVLKKITIHQSYFFRREESSLIKEILKFQKGSSECQIFCS